MRKLIIAASVLAATVAFLPASAHAEEYCEVVKGDGKSLGSEIACGDEHFYILDDNEGVVRALAKYNLNTRTTIYRVDIDRTEAARERQTKCTEIAQQNGGWMRFDEFYGQDDPDHCFYEKLIGGDIIQNENAKSAHWDENDNYLYPQVGDTYPLLYPFIDPRDQISVTTDFNYPNYDHSKYDGTVFFDLSVNLAPYRTVSLSGKTYGNEVGSALYDYKNTLINSGYDARAIDLLSLDDLNTVAKKNGSGFPYNDWESARNQSTILASLKDFVSDDYSWVYDSTYWLKTSLALSVPDYTELTFVNQKGQLCSALSAFTQIDGSACSYLVRVKIGAGVRPVVSMSDVFIYRIRTETDGNGTIEVVEKAFGGDGLSFRTKAKSQYRFKSVTITTDDGESVTFDAGEIEQSDDGTYSIRDSAFTMPFSNITIQASWEKEQSDDESVINPQTIDDIEKYIVFGGVALIVLSMTAYYIKKRFSTNNN